MKQTKDMSRGARVKKRRLRTCQAFFLAALSCVLGLMFCLVKSPQSRAEAYRGIAIEAMAQSRSQDAVAAALESVRLNPAAPQGWQLLSTLLQQNGQAQAAKQALVIAARLQNEPVQSPVYAMPAELRLSLLVLAETGGQ